MADQASAKDDGIGAKEKGSVRVLAEFSLPSLPGNERTAMDRVAEAICALSLPEETRDRLKTAVGEATMNAMEHGNRYQPELEVSIRVTAARDELSVAITDQGGGQDHPEAEPPDLEAKLAGLQSPRGWGLYLIRNMVDEVRFSRDGARHTIELIIRLG